MATLSFNGESYTVDHAVKGADYIHGYDAASVIVVSFTGITDFSDFTYTGVYMEPEHCLAEGCNDVKYVEGALKTRSGEAVSLDASSIGAMPTEGGTFTGTVIAGGSQAMGTAQIRNVIVGTGDIVVGSASSEPEGTLHFVIE